MRNSNLLNLSAILFIIFNLGVGLVSARELDICPGQTIEFEVEYAIAQDFTDNINNLEQNYLSWPSLDCLLDIVDYTYSYPDFNITMSACVLSSVPVGSVFTGDIDIVFYTNDNQCIGLPTEALTISVVAAYIEVTSPSAEDKWPIGSTRFISWDSYNADQLKIELYLGNNNHSLITNSPPSSQNSYIWSIPSDLELGDNYRIKITSLDNSAISDISPYFSIIAAELNPPENLSAILEQGNVVLTWDSYSQQADCDGFKIYRNSNLLTTINSPSITTYTDVSPPAGLMVYYMTAFDGQDETENSNNSAVMVTDIENHQQLGPDNISHIIVSPNPFNPNTTITFDLATNTICSLSIYNYKGQLVKQLINDENMEVGSHSVAWDGINSAGLEVSSGVYFCILKTNETTKTQKLHLIK